MYLDVDVVPLAPVPKPQDPKGENFKRGRERRKCWSAEKREGEGGIVAVAVDDCMFCVADCCPRFMSILLLNAYWILRFLLLENTLRFTTQTGVMSASTLMCFPLGVVGRCSYCAEKTFARIVLSHILPLRSLCIATLAIGCCKFWHSNIGQLFSFECRAAPGLAALIAAIGCPILLQLLAAFWEPKRPT